MPPTCRRSGCVIPAEEIGALVSFAAVLEQERGKTKPSERETQNKPAHIRRVLRLN